MEWTPSYPSCTRGFYKLGVQLLRLQVMPTIFERSSHEELPNIEAVPLPLSPVAFHWYCDEGQQNVIVCFEMDIFDTLSSF